MASIHSGLMLRSGLAVAILMVAAPLGAQDLDDVPASTPSAAPPAADAIGPRELSNFNLNGTVTRPNPPPPSAQPPAADDRETSRVAVPASTEPAPSEPTRLTSSQQRPRPAESAAVDPLSRPPTLSDPATPVRTAAAAPGFSSVDITPDAPIEADYGFSPLPWIAALLLLGAGAAIYFGRHRRGERYAAAGHAPVQAFVPPPQAEPRPAPRAQPVPSPQPDRRRPPTLLRQPAPSSQPRAPGPTSPTLPAGLVSTSLRPWIELEFTPIQARLTDDHAMIAFEVSLYNSGSAPARDVIVEACLINAGNGQDKQLTQFYGNPSEVRDRIPIVSPMTRVPLKSMVRLPRKAVQEYVVEGRKLFMPMVAVNSLYRWSSGKGQSASSFMVGRNGKGTSKLAPLRLDQGAGGWKNLAARRYEKGIRR